MNRGRALSLVIVLLATVVIWWVAVNTYWDQVNVPTPPRGDAATDPFYAAGRFVQELGGTPVTDRILVASDPRDVIVLHNWSWELSGGRRQQLERWVEAGGRLVVDGTARSLGRSFGEWSGIRLLRAEFTEADRKAAENAEQDGIGGVMEPDPCMITRQVGASPWRDNLGSSEYHLCRTDPWEILQSDRPVHWGLRAERGLVAARVAIGRGSLTVLRSDAFTGGRFLLGDHPNIFVAATQLRGGDRIRFVTESQHPSLPALIWMYGAPVVVLASLCLLLALWRNGVRFGPRVAAEPLARRSLAEQIRGVGQFALRFGGGAALHRATLRALNEAAAARIPGFHAMKSGDRVAALARFACVDASALAAAMNPAAGQGRELHSAIALLESARRAINLHRGSPLNAT
jgi:hypothetical protein